ncbi:MAG: YggS family pyridoxal phosphate-dependent enzyme [Planctomycetota bacterium]
MDKALLESNYRDVMNRGEAAAARAGRPPGSWRLVAVTKTVSAEVAAALLELGARELGENRVQELVSKRAALAGRGGVWHMIGHLQRNKVRKVAGEVAFIHSVDSRRLADEIQRVAASRGVRQEVLLEINVAAEESKFGVSPQEAAVLAAEINGLGNVALAGLMTMAPIVGDPEETRPLFARLRLLGEEMATQGFFDREPFELSMGMTQDFEVAIEEGATIVRVGSALFRGL